MALNEVIVTPRQAITNSAVQLSATFYADGVAADPGLTTIGIVDAAGTTVVASGTATSGTGTGPRAYALAAQAALERLTATWTTANLGTFTSDLEVVGEVLFALSAARSFADAALADATRYPASAIEAARARLDAEWTRLCGVSFVPRYRRVVLDGTGSDTLLLPNLRVSRLRAIETRSGSTWTAYTAAELANVLVEPWGLLIHEGGTFPAGRRNVRVAYEHGHERVPPAIRRAALIAVRYELVDSPISERATSITSGDGITTRLWTPGLSAGGRAVHPLPEVDQALREHSERVLGVG